MKNRSASLNDSKLNLSTALAILILLTSCGGGGDNVQSDSAPQEDARTVEALAVKPPLLPPVIFNVSGSPRSGDVISLQGENFGSSPYVFLESAPLKALPVINQVDTGWIAVRLPESRDGCGFPQTRNFLSAILSRAGKDWLAARVRQCNEGVQSIRILTTAGLSSSVKLNGAWPLHLDALQLIPGGRARIFGRNLILPGYTPTVLINGIKAPVDLARSDEHTLALTVPASLQISDAAVIKVDNGNGSGAATLDRTISISRGLGADPFGIGVSWGIAFAPIVTNVIQAATESRLSDKVRCNGTDDDTSTIRAAIDLANADGGGIVQLPSGDCRITSAVDLRSRVVLQGAGKEATVLHYSGNYPIYSFQLDLTGLRNLSLVNTGDAQEGPIIKESSRVIIQNVALKIGSSRQMYLTGNRQMAILGSAIEQTLGLGQQGPFTLDGTSGLAFESNTLRWTSGSPAFARIHDSVIANNQFMRDATDQNTPGIVHSLTLDFAYRVAVVKNSFGVVGGPITNFARNDGESILVEGGSAARTENLGTVASATATTISDPVNTLNMDPFGTGSMPENYGVAIVAGKGAGQTRRVVAYAMPKMTVDRTWDVVPDSTSRYATFVWGLEKSLIKDNVLAQNPRGIWLYGTSVRDVDIVGNSMTEGGGIYMRSDQRLSDKHFTIIYNVLIARNSVSNSTSNWMSYVNSVFVNMDARAYGISTLGVAMRDNQLVTNVPNVTSTLEEYANLEGLMNMMRVESGALYEPSTTPRMLGTLMTDNACAHCDVVVRLGTGATGTTIVNTQTLDSTALLDDWTTTSTTERSTYTVTK